MNFLIVYSLKSIAILAMLYTVYYFFLRKETFFTLNRHFLISSVLVSILLPLLKIPVQSYEGETFYVLMNSIEIYPDKLLAEGLSQRNYLQIILIVYLSVSVLLLINLFRQIILIQKEKLKSEIISFPSHNIYITNGNIPFSFLKSIFLPREIWKTNGSDEIIAHESVHVSQNHSFDNLMIDIAICFFWFNPFLWFAKYSLRDVHEYLADRSAVKLSSNFDNYKKLLISQAFGINICSVTNNFNHSLIKNRLIMMTKNQSKTTSRLRVLLSVPVIAFAVLLFSFDKAPAEQISQLNTLIPVKAKSSILNIADEPQKGEVFTTVEEMPEYPGGQQAFINFLVNNIKFPENARKNGLAGKVFVEFIVEKDGKISSVKVLRFTPHESVDKTKIKSADQDALESEAKRVVNAMPNWKPGKNKGKAVRVKFVVPIAFMLN